MRYFLNTGAFQKRRKSGNQSPVLSSPVLTQMLSIIDLSFYLLTSCNTDIRISCEKQRLWKCYFVEQICRKRRCRRNQGQIILNDIVWIISLSRNAEYVLSLLVCESFSLYNAQFLYRYFPKRCAALRCRPIFSKWEECLDIINVDMREVCSYFLVRTFEFENLVHA